MKQIKKLLLVLCSPALALIIGALLVALLWLDRGFGKSFLSFLERYQKRLNSK